MARGYNEGQGRLRPDIIRQTQSRPSSISLTNVQPDEGLAYMAAQEAYELMLSMCVNAGQRTLIRSLKDLFMDKQVGFHMAVIAGDDQGFRDAWQARISPEFYDVVDEVMEAAAEYGQEWNQDWASANPYDIERGGTGRGGGRR